VAERNAIALQTLIDAGADRELRTRIDDYETALEMAESAGLSSLAELLRGQAPRRLRGGLTLVTDVAGDGDEIRRQARYRIRLRLWLPDGQPVRWKLAWGPVGAATLEDNGETLLTEARVDRRTLFNGLFYGIEGMRVGGLRRLAVAPHLAYGDRGVPGVIPPGSALKAEITILEALS